VQRWVKRLGVTKAEQLCSQTQAVPPLTLRVNTLRTTRDVLSAELASAGHETEPTTLSPAGLLLRKPRARALTALPQFTQGLFYMEEEAPQLIPPLLDPHPGERILDACAAPGGKTTHLAALMNNDGTIMAVDQSAARLNLLRENCRRLDVAIVEAVEADLLG